MSHGGVKGRMKRVMTGKVVSDKMDKTVVIKVVRRLMEPTFKKVITKSKKFKVHDERNECNVGDVIKACECRPLSKDKSWRLLSIVKKAEVTAIEEAKDS